MVNGGEVGAEVEASGGEAAGDGSSSGSGWVPPGEEAPAWWSSLFKGGGGGAWERLLDEYAWLGNCAEAGLSRWEVGFVEPKAGGQRAIQEPWLAVKAQRVWGWGGRGYVCCEGPNHSSVYDFWQMVWEEAAPAILMLNTPLEERLYPKTYNPAHETIQYWPLQPGSSLSFMPWRIRCLSTAAKGRGGVDVCPENLDSVVWRVCLLSLEQRNPVRPSQPRSLLHICYYRWPDGEIPRGLGGSGARDYAAAAAGLLELLRVEVGAAMEAGGGGPLVVHCHAGIGRTGVAVALDMALCRFLATGRADVAATLRCLRRQRPKSVCNVWQYAVVNLALAQLLHDSGQIPASHQAHIDQAWHLLTNDFHDSLSS